MRGDEQYGVRRRAAAFSSARQASPAFSLASGFELLFHQSAMYEVAVQIVRFVDPHQPGFVESELVHAAGCRHTIIDKVPMFTGDDVAADTTYPVSGAVRCEILSRHRDESGRELVRISTAKPDGIESAQGLSEFTVHADLVTLIPD